VKYRWLTRIGVVGALVALLPAGARAQDDTSLPVPQSLTLAPSTVNVAGSPQTVDYTIRVTDDLSGMTQVTLFFYSPSGAQWYDSYVAAPSRVSGDARDGTYASTFVFPQYAEAGTYHLSAYVWDAAGNQGWYSEEALAGLGLPTTLEVISSPEDVTLPQPQSLVLSATTVDVSTGPQSVGYTIRVTDDLSGMTQVTLFFYTPSRARWWDSYVAPPSRVSGDARDGTYASTFVFPQYAEAGTYHLSAYVWDAAGNQGWYSEEALAGLGLPTTVEVISSPEDLTLPQPQSLVLGATTVNVSNGPQTVGYTIRVTDDLSGVTQVTLFFYSPSGAQWYDSYVAAPSRVSGDARDGTYASTFVFPQYAEAGTYHLSAYVWDAAGNQGWYSEEALAGLGLPTTVRVSYNAPPTAEAGANHVALVDEVITLDGSASSDADGTVVGWLWDFGDGASGSGMTVTHSYAGGGPVTITLTVTDDVGATGTDTAVVIVQTLSQAIGSLTGLVAGYNLQHGIANSLDAKLQNAQAALVAANAGQRQDAASKLLAFITAVETQRGKELSNEQADVLEALATRILSVL
jgi:hypothetical protein